MDRIHKLFQDPIWWFGVVFVGIMTSLLAGYLRDGISLVTAYTSVTLRKRRTARLVRQQQLIDLLISDPNVLLVEYARLIINIVMFFGLFFIFMLIPVCMDVIERVDELKRFDTAIGITDLGIKRSIYIDLMLIIGFFDMYVGFTWVSNTRVLVKARKEYISQCEKNQVAKHSLSNAKEE